MNWSTGVRQLFVTQSSTSSPSQPPAPENEGDDSVPVIPIVGGVIGGVLFIAVIAGLLWFLRRKRRAPHHPPELAGVASSRAEMENTQSLGGKTTVLSYTGAAERRISELNAGYLPPEMLGSSGGTQALYEVDGTSRVAHTGR